MRMLILSLAGSATLLSGCIAVPAVPYDAGYHGRHGYGHYSQPVRPAYGPPGHAYRDRDGDGVPNRRDSAPYNPYRY